MKLGARSLQQPDRDAMKSAPGADRGPRAGSPRGVVDATGSRGSSPTSGRARS